MTEDIRDLPIPEKELGEWANYKVLSHPYVIQDSIDIVGSELRLLENGVVKAIRDMAGANESNPNEPGYDIAELSPNGRWLWYLDHVNQQSRISLIDPQTLRVIDSYMPRIMASFWWGAGEADKPLPLLDEWGWASDIHTSESLPDLLLGFGNYGDTYAYLFILRATPDGIIDEVGCNVYECVLPLIDEWLSSVEFISSTQILVVDDVRDLSLVSWQALRIDAERYCLRDGLYDQRSKSMKLWPEDLTDSVYTNVYVYGNVMKVNNILFVPVLLETRDYGDRPNAYRSQALIAFDATTLRPLGRVRMPKNDFGQVFYLGGARIGSMRKDGLFDSWELLLEM